MSQVVFKNTSRNPVPSLVERLCIAHLSLFGETSNLMEERQMILMQGVPGSGKSSIAGILASHINAMVVSNNDYMVDDNNKYCFDPKMIPVSIEKCQNKAVEYVEAGWNLIVDNVNAEGFTVDFYLELAEKYDYRVMVIRTSRSARECCGENIHRVPANSIFNMHSKLSELMN
jgi:broad-specificity NMP kinase